MNQPQLNRQSLPARRPAKKNIRIVALYDSKAAASCVHEAIESIASAGHTGTKVESFLWSFDMLTRLDIRHASIHSAVEADVFIVAGEASSSLPVQVSSWFETALRDHRRGAPVIVLIYEEEDQQSCPLPALRRDLASLAARWRAPLLCQREMHSRLERELRQQVSDPIERMGAGADVDAVATKSEHTHWGINE